MHTYMPAPMHTASIPDSMTIAEAADFLRIHPDTLAQRCRAGLIPGCKIGRSWVFHRGLLDDYLKQRCLERARGAPSNGLASQSLGWKLPAQRSQAAADKRTAAMRKQRSMSDN